MIAMKDTITPSIATAARLPVCAMQLGLSLSCQLQPHIQAVDDCLRTQVRDFEPEIRAFVSYCLDSGGKRIRAALVFLSGWRNGDSGLPAAVAVRVATVIEMVHLATLVHDDIMDAAEIRRNQPVAGVKFGVNRSVLLGDALFAQALNMAAHFPDGTVCRGVSAAARRVCSGEIMQTLQHGEARPDRQRYYRIITLKTAELFRLACELGARTAGHPADFIAAADRFGRHLGIAYQIHDDLLDYFGDEQLAGKTLGSDFRSAKITLPLIVLIERLAERERYALLDDMGSDDEAVLSKWLNRMEHLGVFEEVQAAVERELNQANEALRPFRNVASASMLKQASTILTNKATALARLRQPASWPDAKTWACDQLENSPPLGPLPPDAYAPRKTERK